MEEETLEPDVDFSQLIAQKRANIGMSQAEACRRSGISADTWSRVESASETGQGSQIRLAKALAMLKAVGLRVTIKLDNHQGS